MLPTSSISNFSYHFLCQLQVVIKFFIVHINLWFASFHFSLKFLFHVKSCHKSILMTWCPSNKLNYLFVSMATWHIVTYEWHFFNSAIKSSKCSVARYIRAVMVTRVRNRGCVPDISTEGIFVKPLSKEKFGSDDWYEGISPFERMHAHHTLASARRYACFKPYP